MYKKFFLFFCLLFSIFWSQVVYAESDNNPAEQTKEIEEMDKFDEENIKEISGEKRQENEINKMTGITVTDAWIKQPISPNNNSSLYFTINNIEKSDHYLVNVYATELANNIEIHKSFVDESGIGRMVKIDKVTIPGESSIDFKPGGLHVMLFDLKVNLVLGKIYKINLLFDDGKLITVRAIVKS